MLMCALVPNQHSHLGVVGHYISQPQSPVKSSHTGTCASHDSPCVTMPLPTAATHLFRDNF